MLAACNVHLHRFTCTFCNGSWACTLSNSDVIIAAFLWFELHLLCLHFILLWFCPVNLKLLYFSSHCSAGLSCETKVHYIARHALSMSIVDCAFFAGGTVDGFTARVFRQSNVQIDRLEPGPRPHGLGFPVQCSFTATLQMFSGSSEGEYTQEPLWWWRS